MDEESQQFESIIYAHTSKFKLSNTSINTKIIDNVRKIDSRVQPDNLNRTPGMHRPTYPPSFNTNLNHTSLYTVSSPPLPNTPFIEFRPLENVDQLSHKINQLTSPTCKKEKFSEQISSNAHPQFATPVPTPPSLHTISSSASATDVNYSWYASPIVSSTYPNITQSSGYSKNPTPIREILKTVQATNTSSGSSQQHPIKLVQPKANVHNKSSMPQETNYENLFDQFNVKPKIRMYMRYTSTESEGDVKTPLQCPNLD